MDKLKTKMEEISGDWNGDEPGLQEERAHIANDIIEKIEEIEELMKELDGEHECETDNSAGNVDADGTCTCCGKTDLF
jgi:hypothetical protein